MKDVSKAIEAVWKIASIRLIVAIIRVTTNAVGKCGEGLVYLIAQECTWISVESRRILWRVRCVRCPREVSADGCSLSMINEKRHGSADFKA